MEGPVEFKSVEDLSGSKGNKFVQKHEAGLSGDAEFELRKEEFLRQETGISRAFMESVKISWSYLDGFIRLHHKIEERRIGLSEAHSAQVKIDDFTKACFGISDYFRGVFLDDSSLSRSALQAREIARVIHHNFEEFIIAFLSKTAPNQELSANELQSILLGAHELKGSLGDIMIRMNGLVITEQ